MATIAVLGMGLLGRGFAENALEKGHDVRVWNRTSSKCAPVVEQGAIHAESPADAVRGAERVHLILAEDTAVDAVIGAFLAALPSGTPIIDHSTNLPARVRERVARLAADGVQYLHAPVFMGPSNSRNATGIMLVSGDEPLIAKLKPALQDMTGSIMDLGPKPDKAATLKLGGNGLILGLAGIMGDLFKVGANNGLDPEDILALFQSFKPSAAGMGKRVLNARTSEASFELTMARKDVGLMIEAAGGPDTLAVLPGMAAAMDRSIEAGEGAADFAVFCAPDQPRQS